MHRQEKKSEARGKGAERPMREEAQKCHATSSHACAMRAHHLQQFSFFAVTSVTHASKSKRTI